MHVIVVVTLIGGPDSRLCLIKRYLTVELTYRVRLEKHTQIMQSHCLNKEVVLSSEWSLSEGFNVCSLEICKKSLFTRYDCIENVK